MSKVKCLQKINEMAKTEGLGYDHYKVRAKLAILEKQFKLAESIYLEQVCTSSNEAVLKLNYFFEVPVSSNMFCDWLLTSAICIVFQFIDIKL